MSSKPANYDKLIKVRESENIGMKPSQYLRDKIEAPDGTMVDFELRHYQKQMIYHLLLMKRFIVGDDTGLGKSVEVLAALCYLWEKEPHLKPIVITTTSAMNQWGGEIDKFTQGVDWIIAKGGPDDRLEVYEEYFDGWGEEKQGVLILNYPRLRRDYRDIREYLDRYECVFIGDEATAFKSTKSKTHTVSKKVVEKCERAYGLTATLIKNNLVEGYGIYDVILPDLFRTKTGFYRNYCVTRKQRIPGGRKIPIVVGHSKDHIALFREKIDPFYLGRAKHEVAKELPLLSTKEVRVPVTQDQWHYYRQALNGLITVNEGQEDEEEKETTHLTELTYCQEIVDSPHLIGNTGRSAKEEALLELLDTELAHEKVIVFSRFRTMVDRLQELVEKKGYEYGIENDTGQWEPKTVKQGCVRVTGSEGSQERDAARRAFTSEEGTNLIFLTMAGAEAMNLQQARCMVFFDLPWSAGDYLQLIGRMIRIGSPHQSVYSIHLIAEGPFGELTIDHHVTKTLNKKMGFIEGALGQRILENDGDDEDDIFELSNDTQDIFDQLVKSALAMRED